MTSKATKSETVSFKFPLGTIIPYAGSMDATNRTALAKAGWLLCDGSVVNRAVYSKLYKVIGDIHGHGDASTSFNLPDYRGRFLRGVDAGRGRDPDSSRRIAAAPGGLFGDSVGSVQEDEFRAHDHWTVQMIADNNVDGVDSTTTHSGDHHNERRPTEANGGGESRPKNAYVNWLILAGI